MCRFYDIAETTRSTISTIDMFDEVYLVFDYLRCSEWFGVGIVYYLLLSFGFYVGFYYLAGNYNGYADKSINRHMLAFKLRVG